MGKSGHGARAPFEVKIVAKDRRYTSSSYIKEYPLVVARGKGAVPLILPVTGLTARPAGSPSA
jgi:hypothetical protein